MSPLQPKRTEISMCPICLCEEHDPNCTIDCGHSFHVKCLQRWCLRSAAAPACPVCRADIERMPGEDLMHLELRTHVLGMRRSWVRSAFLRLLLLESAKGKRRALNLLDESLLDFLQLNPMEREEKLMEILRFIRMKSFRL